MFFFNTFTIHSEFHCRCDIPSQLDWSIQRCVLKPTKEEYLSLLYSVMTHEESDEAFLTEARLCDTNIFPSVSALLVTAMNK